MDAPRDALEKIKAQTGTKQVIILVTMKEGFPEFQEVVDKAEATFGKDLLNYAIVKLFDLSKDELEKLIDEATNIKYYSSNFSKLVFLIVAPFGNKDGRKYVKCVDGGHVFVRDIMSKFTSSLVQQNKFFFFDGYLVDGSTSSLDLVTSLDVESLGLENKAAAASQLPKNGNNLIAFSPFLNVLRNDQDKVGKWSMALMKNIQEYVLPVSLLLDKTWDDISPPFVATQEPHFIHSMKPIFLREYEAQDFEDRNALTSEKDIVKDLKVIRHLKPDQTDLETALSDLVDLGEDNPQLWRKKVGDRLAHHLKDLPYEYAKMFIHIIQNIYTHSLKVTWGIILDTLELTHDGVMYPIKIDDERGSVQVSQTVRDYMMRNYLKYYRRAEDMAAEKRSEAAHSRRTAAEQSGAEESDARSPGDASSDIKSKSKYFKADEIWASSNSFDSIAKKKLFCLQGDRLDYTWEKYGFRLHCPEGAASKDTEVTVTALASNSFEVPKDTALVSAVYEISVSKPLLKSLIIELQHCVDTPQPGCLEFVHAPHKPPYQFSIVEGGSFSMNSRYGRLECVEFCLLAIITKIYRSIEGFFHNDILYFGMMYHKRKGEGYWKTTFTVAKDLEALSTYLENEHSDAEKEEEVVRFKFDKSYNQIQLKLNDPQAGWTVKPLMVPVTVHWDDINMLRRVNRTFDVQADLDNPASKQLLHYAIPLIGVTPQVSICINRSLSQVPNNATSSSITNGTSQTRETEDSTFQFDGDVAYEVMKKYTSKVKSCKIEIYVLAEKLLDKKIINERQRDKAIDEHTGHSYDRRMDELLGIVKNSIKEDGKVFFYFIEILKEEDTLLTKKLSSDMKAEYEKMI